jgi:hypothetical protein
MKTPLFSIFGDDFDGVLIADGYAGYNAVNAKQRQTCLAHLIRKSKEIKQEILLKKPRYQDKKSIRFCNRIGKLFKKTCQLAAKFNNDYICQLKADVFQHRLYCALHTICSAKLADDKAETMRKNKGLAFSFFTTCQE